MYIFQNLKRMMDLKKCIMNNKKVMIVGAGIAGPALAIELLKKGAWVTIIEARSREEMTEGLFLGISPNGLNVLANLIDISRIYDEYVPGTLRFYNSKAKQIAELDASYQNDAYGIASIQVKRSAISNLLHEMLIELGCFVEYECKLESIEYFGEKINIKTSKENYQGYDYLIGADGIHSKCRKLLFPDSPQPNYTKMLSTGAVVKIPNQATPSEAIKMMFGKQAFFGFSTTNTGETWWFNNYDAEQEPHRPVSDDESQQLKIKKDLLELHAQDHRKISEIITASNDLFAYPIFDMPVLERWYAGRVCLIGDAAHAISPHTGQGASLALEDGAVLAKCLIKYDDPELAFSRFQQLRSGRVAKIIAQARKIGKAKSKPNWVINLFRDSMLKYFINMEKKKMHWVYGYDVNKLDI